MRSVTLSYFVPAACVFFLFIPPAGAQVNVSPLPPNIPANVFVVTSYGALGDGVATNTAAINAAVLDAGSTNGGGTVEIPFVPGTTNIYLSGPIKLKNKVNLQVDPGVTLRMLPYATWTNIATGDFISAGSNPSDVEISGTGTIDGQATAGGWWQSPTLSTSLRPYLINLSHGARIMIRDVTLKNSPKEHITIGSSSSTNITIQGITINTPASPNTDGMDLTGRNELVRDCTISCGDDNVAITATTADVVVTNCTFGIGHGVSIGGTTGPGGVSNIMVINCTFDGTQNGIRIKSDNGLHGTSPVSGGLCRNLYYLNLGMTNMVNAAIIIYAYYNIVGTPTGITPATAASETVDPIGNTPIYRNIVISNLNATVAGSGIAGSIWGRTELPATNILLSRVNITAANAFDVYNAYQIQFADSKITTTNAGQKTFVLWNAGLVVTNGLPGTNSVAIDGATSASQNLELDNVFASVAGADAFGSSPITLNGGVLTNTVGLTLTGSDVVNFALGTNNSQVVVSGNLNLGATLNITRGGGFTATDYVLFTYAGSLSGTPVLGTTPVIPYYSYRLDTNVSGQVKLVVAAPAPKFGSIRMASAGGGGFVLSGGGGVTNGNYYVLVSTNVTLPLNQWTPIATNPFDGSGNFIFTNVPAVNSPQLFYRLRLP